MPELAQDFEYLACDSIAPLNRLIGIGIGAQCDGPRHIAWLRKFGTQQFRSIGLYEKLALEIEAGRKAHIGVARPRIAVDAAVLAATIGVDRAVEGYVGRFVAC